MPSSSSSQQSNNRTQYAKLRRSDDRADGPVVLSAKGPTAPSSSSLSKTMAWFCMLLAVLAGSAIGPAFKWMEEHNIHELLAASWRCQVMALILIPLAVIEARFFSTPQWLSWDKKPDLRYPVFVYVLVAGMAWGINLILWIVGLEYTTTVRASIFAGMHPLLLVLYMVAIGRKVSWQEWIGVLVSFFGLVFIALFSSNGLWYRIVGVGSSHRRPISSTGSPSSQPWIGDMLCFFAAVAEVVVIMNRESTKHYVPVIQYTMLTTLCVALMTTFGASFYTSAAFFCTDDDCLFGWLSEKWLLVMIIFGFIVGVVCVGGFNFAMQHIHPLVFSCVLLVDPAVTGVLAWLIGVEGIPDVFTIIGGVVVVAGVGLVTVGEATHQQSPSSPSSSSSTSFEMIKLSDEDDDDVWTTKDEQVFDLALDEADEPLF